MKLKILSFCLVFIISTQTIYANPYFSGSKRIEVTKQLINADLHAEFKKNGFFEVKNDYVTKDFYQSIYADFDKIIAEAASNPEFKEDLLSIEKAFRETHYNKVFDGAPRIS